MFYWVAHFVQNRGHGDIAVGCVLFALLAAAMIFPLRWKLRLDRRGVLRRRLSRWDLWRWTDLASGRIFKLHPYTLRDPTRPWWRRKLRLGHMASGDIQKVISVINHHYRLPPPPVVPKTLELKYGFRRSATFDNKGVHVSIRGTPHEYTWGDIEHVYITRMDPLRRDFKSLVIVLPHQKIELRLVTHQGGTSPTWHGATAEEINEFLFSNVAPNRIETLIAGERLKTREQIENKLEAARKKTREFAIIMAIFLPMIAGVLVWMAFDDGVLKAVVMAMMFSIFPGSVIWYMYRSQRKQVAELNQLLTSVMQTDRQSTRNVAT